jgi:hypothetical protein
MLSINSVMAQASQNVWKGVGSKWYVVAVESIYDLGILRLD